MLKKDAVKRLTRELIFCYEIRVEIFNDIFYSELIFDRHYINDTGIILNNEENDNYFTLSFKDMIYIEKENEFYIFKLENNTIKIEVR